MSELDRRAGTRRQRFAGCPLCLQ